MMNPHRDPSLHKQPWRLYELHSARGLGCDKELGDDADIANCCDQGSAIMQPLFPSPPLFQKQTHDNGT